MAAHGSLITLADLEAYEVSRRPTLTGTYRGYDLATNRPGGSVVQVLETLNILEQFDLGGEYPLGTPDYIALMAEALAIACNDKRTRAGDPSFVDVPVGALLDKAYAADLATKVRAGE